MSEPTKEQVAAATAEAQRIISMAHEAAPIGWDTAPYIVEMVADALVTRDAEIANLRARIAALEAKPAQVASGVKVGDRVTSENVVALPVGTVVWWVTDKGTPDEGRATATKRGPSSWLWGGMWAATDAFVTKDPPTYIHSLPTTDAK